MGPQLADTKTWLLQVVKRKRRLQVVKRRRRLQLAKRKRRPQLAKRKRRPQLVKRKTRRQLAKRRRRLQRNPDSEISDADPPENTRSVCDFNSYVFNSKYKNVSTSRSGG